MSGIAIAVALLLAPGTSAAEPGRDGAVSSDAAANPEWRVPRLGTPRAPRFDADADTERVTVRWIGEHVDVRTTVVGGPRRWSRALVERPTHVEVRDTITNNGETLVGFRIRHAVATAEPWVHVGGRARPSAREDRYTPWNPTVFSPVGGGGIGLVAEDDVLRQQVYADADGAHTVGIRTDMLCLAPHDSITLVWSVYPIASRRYWDFANTLRADWGANRTIPGALVWFKPDDVLALPEATVRDGLARQRVAVASMSGGWIDPRDGERPPHLGFGTDVAGPRFAALRERLGEAIVRLKAARAETRVLAYFDTQRESAADAATRFADSLLVDAGGRAERNDWGGRFSRSWSMVPTATNEFGRAAAAAATALRAVGADGLYWDEMDGVDYAAPRVTAAPWDRRSCVLADDGTVRATVGLTNLLGAPLKLAIAEGAGDVLVNGPPTLRAFQARPDLHMVEAQHNDEWGAYAQLTTPLGYVGAGRGVAMIAAKLDEALLIAGTALGEHADLLAHLFPFTPEYIQPGTMRGRERIVTTASGTHGWRDGGEARGWRYGRDAVLVPASWHTKTKGDALLVRVRLAPGEIGIVERTAGAPPP